MNIKNKSFFILFILIALLAGHFVIYRGQDANFDLLNYHIYNGYAALSGRADLDIAPAYIMGFLHPFVDVLYYLVFFHIPFPVSSLIILFLQLLAIPGLFLLSGLLIEDKTEKFSRYAGNLAVILCIMAPLWISELGTSLSESLLCVLTTWGLFFILYTPENRRGLFRFLAGIMFGLASGLKLTNLIFSFSATLMFFYASWKKGELKAKNILLYMLGGIIGFLLVSSHYYFLFKKWGNPVFPFYNHLFQSPYFDLINWRDTRWQFESVWQFLAFLYQTALGTQKTSELVFADARFIIIFLLLPLGLFNLKKKKQNNNRTAFLLFYFLAFLIWSKFFAYQRYLVSTEILMGFVIWILIDGIVENKKIALASLAVISIICALAIKIPDWEHLKGKAISRKESKNITIPIRPSLHPGITSTPANYILLGNRSSWLVPFLHPESRFYGVSIKQLIPLIREDIRNNNLPIRFLFREDSNAEKHIQPTLTKLSLKPQDFFCQNINTTVGRYKLCTDSSLAFPEISIGERLQFSDKANSPYLEQGWSQAESWGIWSDGSTASLSIPLPEEKAALIRMEVMPHVNEKHPQQTIIIRINNIKVKEISLRKPDIIELNIPPSAYKSKHNMIKINFHFPDAISPAELGKNNDTRKLSLGLVSLQFIKQQNEDSSVATKH